MMKLLPVASPEEEPAFKELRRRFDFQQSNNQGWFMVKGRQKRIDELIKINTGLVAENDFLLEKIKLLETGRSVMHDYEDKLQILKARGIDTSKYEEMYTSLKFSEMHAGDVKNVSIKAQIDFMDWLTKSVEKGNTSAEAVAVAPVTLAPGKFQL
jgi:copper homeostasis protein CutC